MIIMDLKQKECGMRCIRFFPHSQQIRSCVYRTFINLWDQILKTLNFWPVNLDNDGGLSVLIEILTSFFFSSVLWKRHCRHNCCAGVHIIAIQSNVSAISIETHSFSSINSYVRKGTHSPSYHLWTRKKTNHRLKIFTT